MFNLLYFLATQITPFFITLYYTVRYIEASLTVDVVSEKELKPRIKERVFKEANFYKVLQGVKKMITIKLKPEVEKMLEVTAKQFGITKSELVRRSIEEYLKKIKPKPSPWELGKDLFGKYSSGKGNLSKNRKNILKQKLLEKYNEKIID